MREYIFQGKSKETGEWVEGYYVKAEKLDKSGHEHFIIEENAEGGSHLVHPESVGQWTGMCDKNGKKIFEGDIVRTQPCSDRPYSKRAKFKEHIGAVKYHIRHFKNRFHEQDYEANWIVDIKDMGEYRCYDWSMFFKCEVIGTVFENADLLEG